MYDTVNWGLTIAISNVLYFKRRSDRFFQEEAGKPSSIDSTYNSSFPAFHKNPHYALKESYPSPGTSRREPLPFLRQADSTKSFSRQEINLWAIASWSLSRLLCD